MTRPKVFVTRLIPEAGLEKLRAACETEVWTEQLPPSREVLLEKIADCEGLLALLTDRIDAAVMDAAPKLKVISNYAVGYNNIDVAAATQRGITVGNTPGVLTEATADLTIALLLAVARQVVPGHLNATSGQWKTWEPRGFLGIDLFGLTLGIVGLGRIGMAVAQRCRGAWGMNVLYSNRRANNEAEETLGARRVDFQTLLAESDVISVHCDLNDSTKGMFNLAAFKKMKPTAIFLNTARGPIVVQPDLVTALEQDEIFGAGLDVTDPEPPSPDDPLLQQPKAVILPHIGSATHTARNGMAEIAAANLLAGLQGEQLPHWVNPEVADRRRT